MTQYSPGQDGGVVEVDLQEDRYHRLRLIPWWDQDRLAAARVLVVGAGALGNEILKQLALLGVGKILIADMDRIEDSNLTRSVLFRHEDEGRLKAEVAAEAVMELNPDVTAQPFCGNIVYDLGVGVYREMDLVFGGLDNREARVVMNQNCWRWNKAWIDGAIEVMTGVARVFQPDGPCYECTMSALDYELLEQRRSCALISKDDIVMGKVPTTPTTAAVIAGIQVQEGIKLLHADRNLPTLAGCGFFFNGLTHDSYVIKYQRRPDCLAHEIYEDVVETEMSAASTSLGEALELVREQVSPGAVLELDKEICTALVCHHCNERQEICKALGKISEAEGRCPHCGRLRDPVLTHSITGTEPYLDRTFAELGLPAYDVFTGREGVNMRHFLLAADRERVLGAIA